MDINARVFAAFRSENKEQLEAIRSIVSKGAGGDEGALNEALRLAHTMKAGARVCGLDGIQELAHRLETLFAQIRDRKAELSGVATAAINTALNVIEDSMVSVAAGNRPVDPSQALGAIDRILD